MDKTMMGLLGGASALALLGSAAEAVSLPVEGADRMPPARTFAELLDPIPNAESVLRAEMERSGDSVQEKPIEMAQYYYHHHHHHHHHYYYYRRHHHHHHHYHHHYYYY